MNHLEQWEQKQTAHTAVRPDFAAGDTVRVMIRVSEGERSRLQAFEGICIARKHRGLRSSFTVRKISHGEGVERVFPLHAPQVAEITVLRRGAVRRAKLYYLRGRRGKAARIRSRDLYGALAATAETTPAPETATTTDAPQEAAPQGNAPQATEPPDSTADKQA